MKLEAFLSGHAKAIRKDFDSFEERKIESIVDIAHKAPLDVPVWLKTPELVCAFIDLTDSTRIANKKGSSVTAKVYMAFSQNLFDVLDMFNARYIDIRGDGGFALFEGPDAHNQALAASITFAILNDRVVRPLAWKKFKVRLHAKVGIEKGSVLASRIGLRNLAAEQRNAVAWAGPLINNTKLLSDIGKLISMKKLLRSDGSTLVISEQLCQLYASEASALRKRHSLFACACEDLKTVRHFWKTYLIPPARRARLHYDLVHYAGSGWCVKHVEEYLSFVKERLDL